MKKEIIGLGKFALIVLTVVLGFRKLWIPFSISLVLTLGIFYIQEYRKMYGDKKSNDK